MIMIMIMMLIIMIVVVLLALSYGPGVTCFGFSGVLRVDGAEAGGDRVGGCILRAAGKEGHLLDYKPRPALSSLIQQT